MYASPIYVPYTTTFDRLSATTGTSFTTSGNARYGIYDCNTSGEPNNLILDAGTVAFSAASTGYSITINQTLTPGWYFLVFVSQSGNSTWFGFSSAQTNSGPMGRVINATSTNAVTQYAATGATGALPSTFGAVSLVNGNQPAMTIRAA